MVLFLDDPFKILLILGNKEIRRNFVLSTGLVLGTGHTWTIFHQWLHQMASTKRRFAERKSKRHQHKLSVKQEGLHEENHSNYNHRMGKIAPIARRRPQFNHLVSWIILMRITFLRRRCVVWHSAENVTRGNRRKSVTRFRAPPRC